MHRALLRMGWEAGELSSKEGWQRTSVARMEVSSFFCPAF